MLFGVCLATMLTMSEFRRRRFSFSYHLQTQRCSPLWVLQERHARKGEALFSGLATTLTVLNGALADQRQVLFILFYPLRLLLWENGKLG